MSNGGALAYEYAITTSATPPTSGTSTTATFYAASGLLPQTVYYLHVRSSCTGGTFGNWSTVSFTTACAEVTSFIQNLMLLQLQLSLIVGLKLELLVL